MNISIRQHNIIKHHKSSVLFVLILIIVGISRISIFFIVQTTSPGKIFSPDSISYANTARALLKTGRFAISPDKPNIPQVMRTPGYPFFIASIFLLFGERYSPLIITQILLSLGTIIITYRMVTLIWGTHVAVIAALLLSLDISSLISSQQVLTETLFTFVLSVAIISIIYILKKPQRVVFLSLFHGIFLSLAILIRPVAYYLIFLIIVTFVIMLKTYIGLQWKKIVLAIIILIIPWIIFVGGWQWRNYLVTGKAEFSYIQGANLLFYRCAGIIAEREEISFQEARHRLGYGRYAESHPETKEWSLAQLDQHWKRQGVSLIYQNPMSFLKSQIRGTLKIMLDPGESTFMSYIRNNQEKTGPGRDFFELSITTYVQKWVIERTGFFLLFLLAASYLVLIYASIIFSLSQLIKARVTLWSVHVFLWVVITYFIAISAGPGAYSRFRIPIMPLLSVYAGHGIYQILTRLTRTKHC